MSVKDSNVLMQIMDQIILADVKAGLDPFLGPIEPVHLMIGEDAAVGN